MSATARRYRVYVGTPGSGDIHLDQGGLSWQQAHDELAQWLSLYAEDERDYLRQPALDALEDIDDPWMIGRPAMFDLDGEWHAIAYDYRQDGGPPAHAAG